VEVVLAGASGLIGTALRAGLRADGHRVKTLVRQPVSGRADVASWDPARGLLDPAFLASADAVVCLSGAGVGARRWTPAYKQTIWRSRVDSVATLARTLAEHGGPRILVAASAVGYYGDTGDVEVDEAAPPGATFLSRVCAEWEAAADPARAAGVRVVHLRSGLVLAKAGGLLARLIPLVRLGIGGPLGSGRQFYPWIALADELAAIRFVLDHDVAGPVNLTAPAPVRNADFTRALGRVLHRPTVLRVPGPAARLALGEFATEVLIGQRAVPRRLLDAGFRFAYPDLDAALRAELALGDDAHPAGRPGENEP
jgi:uncharacterized protein (TIGR01777 family)